MKRYGRIETGMIFSYLPQGNTTLRLVAGPLFPILSDLFRHFYHPHLATSSFQLVRRQLQDKPIKALAVGQANQNAPFNDPITLSTNQSAPCLRLGHAFGTSGRVEGVYFDVP